MGLDANDEMRAQGEDYVEDMIKLYLSGKTDSFRELFFQMGGEDHPLMKKFYAKILTKRNQTIADRIHGKLTSEPLVPRFYAVGAAHYGDEDGINILLEQKGVKITRVVPEEESK